jgi:hypothetical protein
MEKSNLIQDQTILSNMRVFRYMNRHHDEKLVEWKLDLLLHRESTILAYQKDWSKMMDVIEEIEKDEEITNITVSTKGTAIKFKSGEDLFEKVAKKMDKKMACWSTIIKYLERLDKK